VQEPFLHSLGEFSICNDSTKGELKVIVKRKVDCCHRCQGESDPWVNKPKLRRLGFCIILYGKLSSCIGRFKDILDHVAYVTVLFSVTDSLFLKLSSLYVVDDVVISSLYDLH
jgi:hypothetical protein